MKAIIQLVCLLIVFVFASSAPVLDKSISLPLNPGIIAIDICPIPMCMAIQQPCNNIQTSYMMVNGKKCPMCQYCASAASF